MYTTAVKIINISGLEFEFFSCKEASLLTFINNELNCLEKAEKNNAF